MLILIEIIAKPIDARPALPIEFPTGVGARAEFSGIVRREEDGRVITALEYEAYLPMAEKVMREIIEDIGRNHPCLSVRVTHRIGIVPVGETAIHIMVASRHRAEAFAMLTEFMNRLKQDVPIWKRRALSGDELEALKKS
jgi:molybdopterin synthase catalytic subunit